MEQRQLSDKALSMYRDILSIIEKRSTCVRVKVASLLVKDHHIVSTGWNGVPSGHEHCEDVFGSSTQEYIDRNHHEWSIRNEAHSEQNNLAYAAKRGINTEGATLFISVSPCTECSKLIISAGIKSVYFKEFYDRGDTAGLELMKKSGIIINKLR